MLATNNYINSLKQIAVETDDPIAYIQAIKELCHNGEREAIEFVCNALVHSTPQTVVTIIISAITPAAIDNSLCFELLLAEATCGRTEEIRATALSQLFSLLNHPIDQESKTIIHELMTCQSQEIIHPAIVHMSPDELDHTEDLDDLN